MTRHYVSIAGLKPEALAFFGIQLIDEDDNFAFYIDAAGEPQIVDKRSPHIYVDDINDAMHITDRAIAVRDS